MLDIKFIREHPEAIKEALQKRGVAFDVDYLISLDEKRRGKIREVEEMRSRQNGMSDQIPRMEGDEKKQLIKESKTLKTAIGNSDFELQALEEEFISLMYKIPNMPDPEVPPGKDDTENKVLHEGGEKSHFDFPPRDYVSLGETLDLIDTDRAAKVSGARFGYLKHEAPLLEFALVQMVFSRLFDESWLKGVIKKSGLAISSKPFIPLVPPVMIRPEVFRAMGKLDPGQEEERYFLPKDNLYLIGSAEHTTGAMHMDEILNEEKLPHRHIAFSTCFRREAGSYGKDTRGILRVHQFDKLEMFSFASPENYKEEHEFFCSIQQALMDELKLPYRVMLICAGDMVWSDAKQYDIETWLPGQNGGKGEYRETHSTSNTTDFQSRRLNIKYRSNVKGQMSKVNYVHMLNGTALAIGRMIIAILENYQTDSGSIKVPKVLQEYLGMQEIKK